MTQIISFTNIKLVTPIVGAEVVRQADRWADRKTDRRAGR